MYWYRCDSDESVDEDIEVADQRDNWTKLGVAHNPRSLQVDQPEYTIVYVKGIFKQFIFLLCTSRSDAVPMTPSL